MKKSKFLSLALIALFVLSLSLSAFAAETTDSELTFTVEASASTVKAGDEVTFTVSLAENPGFKWARTELRFDPAVLTYKSTSIVGSIYEASTYYTETGINELGSGLLKFTMGDMFASLGAGTVDYTGTGLLFSATFVVAEGYEGSFSVEAIATNNYIRDLNNQINTMVVNSDTCSLYCVSADHVHTVVDIPATDPTCTEPGNKAGSKCSVCGEVIVTPETIAATGHTTVVDAPVDPTCTTGGKTEGSHCEICGEVFVAQEDIAPTGHTEAAPVRENEVPASCGDDGSYDMVVYCSVCNAELSRETIVVNATGEHNFAIEVERVAPTCTEPGYVIMACGCGETQRTESDALGHTEGTPVKENDVSGSCSTDGSYDMVVYCTVCEEELSRETTVIPATGEHVYSVEVERVAATCEEDGYVIMACSCGEIQRSSIDAVGHTEQIDAAVPATCSTTGLTEGSHCSVCNKVLVAQEETPFADHSLVTLEGYAATCTEKGLSDGSYCSVCGFTNNQVEIPAKGHTEVTVPGFAATCVLAGKTSGSKCSECGIPIVEQTIIAPTGHTPIDVAAVEPTCTSTGLTAGTFCAICNETLSGREVVEMTAHTLVVIEAVAPTCSYNGWTEGTRCTVCQNTVDAPEYVEKLAHNPVVIDAIAATCKSSGWTEGAKCSECNATITDPVEIPALEHTYDNDCDTDCNSCGEVRSAGQHSFGSWTVTKEATEDETGEQIRTCVNCGHQESQVIPALQSNDNMGLIVGVAFVVMIACVVVIIVIIRKKK